jgi:hypothetical protein
MLLAVARTVRAELGAVEVVGPELSPSFRPDTVNMPQVITGPYLAAVAAYGSPGDTDRQLYQQPAGVRTQVDAMLLRGLPMRLMSAFAPPPNSTSCKQFRSTAWVVADLPPTGLWITATRTTSVIVSARSFSPTFLPVTAATVAADHTLHLLWSGSSTLVHWQVAMQGTAGIAVSCTP